MGYFQVDFLELKDWEKHRTSRFHNYIGYVKNQPDIGDIIFSQNEAWYLFCLRMK